MDNCNSLSRPDDCITLTSKLDFKGVVDPNDRMNPIKRSDICVDNVMQVCVDLNDAFSDNENVYRPSPFVPELKRNRFGKFLTEEIPKFTPSSTDMSCSEESQSETDNTIPEESQSDTESDISEPDCNTNEESSNNNIDEPCSSESSCSSKIKRRASQPSSSKPSPKIKPKHSKCFRCGNEGHVVKKCHLKSNDVKALNCLSNQIKNLQE